LRANETATEREKETGHAQVDVEEEEDVKTIIPKLIFSPKSKDNVECEK